MRSHRTVDSPLGALCLVAGDGGLAALVMGDWPAQEVGERDDAVLPEAVEQLAEYFAGERRTFDLVLTPAGTPWQHEVWAALRTIPYGQTRTYGEVAASLGRPSASRAVGAANGRNPIGLVVPCHRVVGGSGTLTGYAGGVERKRWLLDHESGGALF